MDEETRKKLEEWNSKVGSGPLGSSRKDDDLEKQIEAAVSKRSSQRSLNEKGASGTPQSFQSEKPEVDDLNQTNKAPGSFALNTKEEKKPLPTGNPPKMQDKGKDFIPQQDQQQQEKEIPEASTNSKKNLGAQLQNLEQVQQTAHPSEQQKESKINPIEEARQREQEKNKKMLARLRTYESDAAEAINRKKASVSSIVLAEQAKATDKEGGDEVGSKGKKSKAALFFLVSIILIAGGLGSLYGWYTFVYLPNQDQNIGIEETETLVPGNETEEIIFTSEESNLREALNGLKNDSPISSGEIYSINFVTEEENSEGQIIKRQLSSRSFLEALNTRAPIPLYRSLEPRFSYGVHKRQENNSAFLVFKASFFENAFASMLDWEESLAQDLSFLVEEVSLPEEPESTNEETNSSGAVATSTETATSTEEVNEREPITLRGMSFKDTVIENTDARILRDNYDNVRLLYSFPNQETLIITGNVETFKEILRRLNIVEFE